MESNNCCYCDKPYDLVQDYHSSILEWKTCCYCSVWICERSYRGFIFQYVKSDNKCYVLEQFDGDTDIYECLTDDIPDAQPDMMTPINSMMTIKNKKLHQVASKIQTYLNFQ